MSIGRECTRRDTAADQPRSWRGATQRGEAGRVSRGARARAGHDEGVGPGALGEIAGDLGRIERRQRHGMLDEQIGPDLDADAPGGALAQQVGRRAFDQPLVGQHRAGEHVDANELRLGGGGSGECGACVVAQHVDAEREVAQRPDRAGGRGQRRDRLGPDRGAVEGLVAVILDEDALESAFQIGLGIAARAREDRRDCPAVARGSRQRRQVDDAEDRLVMSEEFHRPRSLARWARGCSPELAAPTPDPLPVGAIHYWETRCSAESRSSATVPSA